MYTVQYYIFRAELEEFTGVETMMVGSALVPPLLNFPFEFIEVLVAQLFFENLEKVLFHF